MKTLTEPQPRASLAVAGVVTILTRSRPTSYRGRIAIHAAGRWEPGWHECVNPDGPDEAAIWRQDVLIDHLNGHPVEAANDDRYWTVDVRHVPLGAVVGSAVLTDCVPIVADPENVSGGLAVVSVDDTVHVLTSDSYQHEYPGQAPFGDFTPGRWAWLLADATSTTERCPWCWGWRAVPAEPDPYVKQAARLRDCPVCDGSGRCDPVPARGHGGLWEWAP